MPIRQCMWSQLAEAVDLVLGANSRTGESEVDIASEERFPETIFLDLSFLYIIVSEV